MIDLSNKKIEELFYLQMKQLSINKPAGEKMKKEQVFGMDISKGGDKTVKTWGYRKNGVVHITKQEVI